MSDSDWIWITRWEDFQHYAPKRERGPAWIKDYTAQLDDERYLALKDHHRALLHDLRILFAQWRCKLPASPSMISQALGYATEWDARRRRASGESLVSDWRVAGESLASDGREESTTRGESVVRSRDLQRLEQAGFLELISRETLEQRLEKLYSRSRRRNRDTPRAVKQLGTSGNGPTPTLKCPRCGVAIIPARPDRLHEHLANVHDEHQ